MKTGRQPSTITSSVDALYCRLLDKEFTEPMGVDHMPELHHLLCASSDVDVHELMEDFHIAQGAE